MRRCPRQKQGSSSQPPSTSVGNNTPLASWLQQRFDERRRSAAQRRLSCTVLQLMPLERVAELIVAEAQRHCSRALVEPISVQRILEQLALIGRDGGAEVVG